MWKNRCLRRGIVTTTVNGITSRSQSFVMRKGSSPKSRISSLSNIFTRKNVMQMYILLLLSLLSLPALCDVVGSNVLKGCGCDRLNGVHILPRIERCRNPWNGKCRNTNIELYIMYKGRVLPICRRCWSTLAKKPVEWGSPGRTHVGT